MPGQEFDTLQCRPGDRRRESRVEDERPALVDEVVHDRLRGAQVCPVGAEGLGEGPHLDLDLPCKAEVIGGPATPRRQRPRGMGVIDDQGRAILFF